MIGVRPQTQIYLEGVSGRRPLVPLDAVRLETAAERCMRPEAFAYVAAGAGNERTLAANRALTSAAAAREDHTSMVIASVSDGIISVAGAILGAIAGALVGGYVTRRAALPYFQQAALQRASALVQARVAAYAEVLKYFEGYSDEHEKAVAVDAGKRRTHGDLLRHWYHQQGGGLLLGGDAFNRFRQLRDALYTADASPDDVYAAVTSFRSELKVDVGSREPSELPVPFAESTDRRLRKESEQAARGRPAR